MPRHRDRRLANPVWRLRHPRDAPSARCAIRAMLQPRGVPFCAAWADLRYLSAAATWPLPNWAVAGPRRQRAHSRLTLRVRD